MLNSPLLESDNFLNEAHYVLIDFSYSLSEVNTPKVLLSNPSPCSTHSLSLSKVPCLSPPPSIVLQVSYQSLPERRRAAEHLRELNGFQLAKQIPPLTLTLSHSASESLAGHYGQLEFNKPNMLTVLIEREGGRWGVCALIIPLSLVSTPSVAVYFLLL